MLQVSVSAQYPDFVLDVSTTIPLNCATAIIGPNGSGKTTLIRSVAGLTSVDGRISLGESVWLDADSGTFLPVHKRPVGYMSQSPVLLPHLSVRNNLRFADFLSKRKDNPNERIPVDAIVDSLNVRDLLDRRPHALSGGEVSRVALAQALMCKPRLLMLDEPLASVDVDRKAEFVPYLKSVLREYQVPMLYVTHSLSEVAALCERTVVLRNGQVHMEGETSDVLQNLKETDDVLDEFEAGSVLHGKILRHDPDFHLTYLSSCEQELVVPTQDLIDAGEDVRFRVRARDVSLATSKPEQISIRNILEGRVLQIDDRPDAPHCEVHVRCGDEVIRALVTRASVVDLRIDAGSEVFALIKSVTIEY